MKLRLKVRRAGSPPGESASSDEWTVFDWDFEKNSFLVGGRGDGTGIVLPHPTVSTEHFCIEPGNGRWIVTDPGSLNGTFLNGRKLVPCQKNALSPGDVLGVGPFVLLVSDPRTESLEKTGLNTRSLAIQLARRMIGDDPEERPYVTVEKGHQQGARLSLPLGQPVVIGRDAGCHLSIADPDVSRRHVKIYNTIDGCWLSDMESKNGVFVDERKVTGAWRLENGRRIKLGETVLLFSDPAEVYLESLEKMADQAIGENGGVFETGIFDDFITDAGEKSEEIDDLQNRVESIAAEKDGGCDDVENGEDESFGDESSGDGNSRNNEEVIKGGENENSVDDFESSREEFHGEGDSERESDLEEEAGLGWILLLILGGIAAAAATAALIFLIRAL